MTRTTSTFRSARAPSPIAKRNQPLLPCVSFNLAVVLESVRRERVPTAPTAIPVWFFDQPSLACITSRRGLFEDIGLHALLNTPQTPLSVFQFIFTHELLHTVVPAREVNGKMVAHPPEFFERQKYVTPEAEMSDAWDWVWANFGLHLKSDTKRERITVKRSWKMMRGARLMDIAECRA